jgi:acyl-CoA thioester hydrolase
MAKLPRRDESWTDECAIVFNMARIKLDLPPRFIFETALTVRVTDLNYGNHLGNDALLGMIHEARVRFLRSLGYSELDVEGVGLIMCDCAIVYKAQGFLGDELSIEIGAMDFTRTSCDLLYLLKKADGSELARAKTGIAFFDYREQAVKPVPEGFRKRLQA